MSLAIDIIDGLIEETIQATQHYTNRFGVGHGITTYLLALKEARQAILVAEMRLLEGHQ